jgi:MFS family permease
MGIFYLGPLCGPLFAPIIGGALTQGLGWRSTQWFQTIYGFGVFLAILFFLPETHHILPPVTAIIEEEALAIATTADNEKSNRPTLSRSVSRRSVKSAAVTTRKYLLLAKRIFIDPLLIIRYLRFPPVALTVSYASVAFGCLYFLNISVETTFSGPPYNFGTIEVGLLYISNSLGYLVMSLLGGPWVDRIMTREAKRAKRYTPSGKLILLPEDRMGENVWLGAFLMPAALLWYGWTGQYLRTTICNTYGF